uniref:Putative secreted protein n=1 Tax=Anopheles darlingi TaxID=43151 RepID=A0A2M4D6R6_ANODA
MLFCVVNAILSTTIAANFQSLMSSASSSAFRMRLVMNCSSFSMWCKSLCVQPVLVFCSSTVVRRVKTEPPMAVVEPDMPEHGCRKSSSMSSTFASNDFEDRSFSSSSFMRLLSMIVLRVIFLPGRPIRRIHGSHWRKTDLIHGGISWMSAVR